MTSEADPSPGLYVYVATDAAEAEVEEVLRSSAMPEVAPGELLRGHDMVAHVAANDDHDPSAPEEDFTRAARYLVELDPRTDRGRAAFEATALRVVARLRGMGSVRVVEGPPEIVD